MLPQEVAQRRQVVGVGGGVREHLVAERTRRPVSALELLVQLHPEVLFEQRREPDARLVEELRRHSRVEERTGAESILALEEAEVVIRIVEDDLDRRVAQQGAEPAEIGDRERVDHDRGGPRRDLQQIDLVFVAMEARGLRVDRDQGVTAGGVKKGVELGLIGEKCMCGHAGKVAGRRGHRNCPKNMLTAALLCQQ
jgi:hypothetical protein